MSFFYDLNKKLDSIRATPEVTHKQLNERDEGKPGKNFAKIAKDAGERYGSKAAGERVAGAVRNKLGDQGKLEEEGFPRIQAARKKFGDDGLAKLRQKKAAGASPETMRKTRKELNQYDNEEVNEMWGDPYHDDAKVDAINAANPPKVSGTGTKPAIPVKHHTYDRKAVASNISGEESAKYDYRGQMEEGPMDTVKKIGKKVAGGVNRLVGHGSDEDMRKDVQRKAGVPPTGKKPNFADKIANAKKEVDEMLGDVAAEAMRKALGGGKGRNAEMDEEKSKGTAFDMSTPRAAAPKVGSIERGHKHDIKHTATGRMVTRRVDDQGNSVGADDDSDTQAGPRGRGRPKGTKGAIGAKGPSGRSKLMTKEGEVDIRDQGEYDQEGDMAKDDIKTIVRHAQALSKVLGDNDNLPEWVQSKLSKIEGMMISIDEYMQNQEEDDEEEPIAEKAVSKQQQKFMGMAHAMQKGEKVKGASKELKKVASTMKPKDVEDFAKTKHKGLPDKAKSKKKEEDVEESTTSGSVATSSAAKSGGAGMVGKGIYDSMNRELENMIAESMTINMSDSTEGGKSLTITATDEDALKLGIMLKNAGLGSGDAHGGDMHSHGEEPCATCGMPDCGCGDVQEAVDDNAPDYPTNTEQADNNFGYAGGLNRPKTDVAGDGQTTVPVVAAHTQDEDALRRMMEMAGLAEAAKPDYIDLDKDGDKEESMKDAAADADEEEDTVKESIRRMMEIAGVKKKPMDEQKTEEGNLFTKGLKDDDVKIGDTIPGTNAIKKKDIDESIFALTNQWQAYKG